jgi:multiple sugar transport system permease protein
MTAIFGNLTDKQRERNLAWMMMAPAALLLLAFLIVPFFMAFGLSMTDQRLISPNPTEFVGLDNYERLLKINILKMEPLRDEDGALLLDEDGNTQYERARTLLRADDKYAGMRELTQIDLFGSKYLIAAGDPVFYKSLRNIFYFVIVVVPLQTGFALCLAMLVNQKIRGANFFRTIYFSPVVTAMAVVAILWFFLYNPDQGLINAVLGIFGIGKLEWLESPSQAMPAIMILSIWQGVGFQMIIYLAGLQEIPDSLYEASALDGANRWQQFRFITFPSLRNTTIFVVVSTTILAFKLFTQVEVMTFGRGGPEDSTITTVLHMVNQGFREQRVAYASAIAVVFVLIVLSITLLQRRIFVSEEAMA